MSVGVSSTDNARPRDAAADAGWPGHTGLHVARLPGQEHCGTQGRWTNSSGRRGGDVEVTPQSCGFLKNGVKSTGRRQAQTRLPSVFKFVTSENKTIVFVHLLRLRKARTSPERGSGMATGRGVGRGGEPRLLPSSAVPESAETPERPRSPTCRPGPSGAVACPRLPSGRTKPSATRLPGQRPQETCSPGLCTPPSTLLPSSQHALCKASGSRGPGGGSCGLRRLGPWAGLQVPWWGRASALPPGPEERGALPGGPLQKPLAAPRSRRAGDGRNLAPGLPPGVRPRENPTACWPRPRPARGGRLGSALHDHGHGAGHSPRALRAPASKIHPEDATESDAVHWKLVRISFAPHA